MSKQAFDIPPGSGDRALWAEAMRDVRPLRGRAPVPVAAPPGPRPESLPSTAAEMAPARAGGIDRATAERLRRGRYPIEARLDLHGLTQAQAHHELAGFVEASYHLGRRCVLIVTGRGLGPDGPGVLKTAVPRWLDEAALRRRILAMAAAQPRHGGAGALYLLLRRKR